MNYTSTYFASAFVGVGMVMPRATFPQVGNPDCARSIMSSGVSALEDMLLAKFRKLGPVGLGDGRIRVIYKDADLHLNKTETMARGDSSPSETTFWLDGSERRHTLKTGMTALEMREVTCGLVAEIESVPTLAQILASRADQRQKGEGR